MNEKLIIFVVGIIIGACLPTALYLRSTREYGELKSAYDDATAELGRARQSLDAVRARAAVAEQGLADAIGEVSAITDRNRRITILVDTIRATIKQLREIVESGKEATGAVANSSDG